MRLRTIVAATAVGLLALIPSAGASPYNETCGDGTPHGCIQHCLQYHGGLRNLDECLWSHYLV